MQQVGAVRRSSTLKIGLALLVMILLGGAVYSLSLIASGGNSPADESGGVAIPHAVARIGSLTVSVTGSGELMPAATTELGFAQSGKLMEVLVKAGDEVMAGQLLARLQIDKSEAELAAEIAQNNLAVLRAQQALDQIYTDAQMATAQALVSVEESQLALDELADTQSEIALARQAVAAARELVAQAEMELYILNSSPSEQDRYIAYASLLFKEKDLQELQGEVARVEFQIKSAPNDEIRERLRTQLLNLQVRLSKQQAEVDKARDKYASMGAPPDTLELSVVQAKLNTTRLQLTQAQQELLEAEASPSAGELALAEARLAEAHAEWEQLKNGPDPTDIALAEAQMKKAQAQLAQVQGQPLLLELVALRDSLVTAVNASVGDRVQAGSILTLAVISQLKLFAYFDEADRANVQAGYRVQVVFDAMPDIVFSGHIVEINPSLVTTSFSPAIEAFAVLEPQESIRLNDLPLGLNATIEVIAGEAKDVVLVPLEALRELPSGEFGVFVLHGEELELRRVTVGLSDFTSAVILEGLSAGEAVAIGDIESIAGDQ